MDRLQKEIAQRGYCSRRKAEDLIVQGKVKVNGIIINQLGYKVEANDEIEIEGHYLKRCEKVVYMLNKPKHVLSSTKDDRNRDCVLDLIDCAYRLYPIGRLDFDSSGLLLLSNDGQLTNALLHPKYKIPKTYEVTIQGLITKEEILTLSKGVILDDGFKTGKCQIKLVQKNLNKKTSQLLITIYEGHNRQIRRMFETLNYQVIRLHRISIGPLQLGNLRLGQARKLKAYEIVTLKNYLKSH